MSGLFKVFLILSIALNSPALFADDTEIKRGTGGCETSIHCMVKKPDAPLNKPPPGAVPGTTGTTPNSSNTTYGTAGAAGTGAYEQAQKAKDSGKMTMMLGIAAAAAFLPVCMNPKTSSFGCPLMAAGLMAAMLGAQKADEAQDLMNSLGVGGQTPPPPSDTNTASVDGGTSQADITRMRADLAKKGYTLSDNGALTLPNGQTAADMSKDGLMNAGVNAADAGRIQEGLDSMRSDFQSKLAAEAARKGGGSDGGGGSATVTSYDNAGEIGNNKNTAASETIGVDRDPASWTGFFKPHGDGVIGVSNGDIFMMVEKRVETERKIMEN